MRQRRMRESDRNPWPLVETRILGHDRVGCLEEQPWVAT